MSEDKLSDLNENDVVEVAVKFLNDQFEDKFSAEISFANVHLKVDEAERRLAVKKSILCSGHADFNSKTVPSTDFVDKLIQKTFSDSKDVFLEMLRNSGSSYSKLLNAGATEKSSVLKKMHLTIIFVIGGVAISVVAISLFVKFQHKRGIEKKVQAYGQEYQAQVNEFNLDIEFLEPQPLEISDDEKAIERNMIRSEYERTVIRKANETLRRNIGEKLPNRDTTTIRFGTNIAYGSNGTVIDEDGGERDDEDATISSIQFSSSLESAISSLGALNPIPEYDEASRDNSIKSQDDSQHPGGCCVSNILPEETQPLKSSSTEDTKLLSVEIQTNPVPNGAASPPAIGFNSPQSMLSSLGFSFGSVPADSMDEDESGGDNDDDDDDFDFSDLTSIPTIKTKDEPCTTTSPDKSRRESSTKLTFFQRFASPRGRKSPSQRQRELMMESKDEDNPSNDIVTLDHDLEANLSLDQNRNTINEMLGVEYGQPDQDNTTDQNAGENSYYTSIFTRKY